MGKKMNNLKNKLKIEYVISLIIALSIIILVLGIYIYNRENAYTRLANNEYNMAFTEVVDYVQNVETYLAKSLISNSPEHGAEVLTHVWREANLAQAYLAMLPIGSEELANTSKFLNQVSDYSYSLSRKNINNEALTQDDFNNLKNLHNYSVELENTLNQLSSDMNDGRIKWSELNQKGSTVFATEVSNISKDSFSNLEENFHEYSGLIYDGAFSEHLTSIDKKGLTGENVDEETAKQIAIQFLGNDKIKEINSSGLSENTDMPCYDFNIILKNEKDEDNVAVISISQKGGHVVFMNYNRSIEAETITENRANEIGKDFLNTHGFSSMKETYYLKQEGVLTINYAYLQSSEFGDTIIYSDLVKLKIALDNGQIMGIETTGYLNSHYQRNIENVQITKEEAKQTLNNELQIESESLAIIPTEFQTEILCWEFKGKVDDTEFLVYINVNNGKEEDILVIKDTPNGTLTM